MILQFQTVFQNGAFLFKNDLKNQYKNFIKKLSKKYFENKNIDEFVKVVNNKKEEIYELYNFIMDIIIFCLHNRIQIF